MVVWRVFYVITGDAVFAALLNSNFDNGLYRFFCFFNVFGKFSGTIKQ